MENGKFLQLNANECYLIHGTDRRRYAARKSVPGVFYTSTWKSGLTLRIQYKTNYFGNI